MAPDEPADLQGHEASSLGSDSGVGFLVGGWTFCTVSAIQFFASRLLKKSEID